MAAGVWTACVLRVNNVSTSAMHPLVFPSFCSQGSLGELSSNDANSVRYKDFATGKVTMLTGDPNALEAGLTGHGGADHYCTRSFVEAVRKGDRSLILTDPRKSLRSHLVVYAAEASRRQRRVVCTAENGWPSVGTEAPAEM